ncbi:T9SS type A sorting domain-containing protein [Salinivirga cyanobacteriivorans]
MNNSGIFFTKIFLVSTLLMCALTVKSQTATPPSAGDGTADNPYEISNLDNLYWLTQDSLLWDKHYVQIADIDASATIAWNDSLGFDMIGTDSVPFSGNYDGQHHTIDYLYINRPDENKIAFFKMVSNSAQVSNLGLININFTGLKRVGGLFTTCKATVSNCYTHGSVHAIYAGTNVTGGFAAASYGYINNCYSDVEVSSPEGNYIAGFVGTVDNNSMISNSYSLGSVVGNVKVGGFLGTIGSGSIINNCYTATNVSGNESAGGFSGLSHSGADINNCFWDSVQCGTSISADGIPLNTEQMQNATNFINEDWDFAGESVNGNEDIWGMNCNDNGGYPFLGWQGFTDDLSDPVPDAASLEEVVAECEVAVLDIPTATDDCSGQIEGTPDVEFPVTQTTLITWTFDDTNGNYEYQTQQVTINDATQPVPDESALPDITAECEVTQLNAPTATDDCTGTIEGTHNADLPITTQGTTVVTWIFIDDNGNIATQTQNVVIEDNTAPVPDLAEIPDTTSQCEVNELTAPTATDECMGIIEGTHNANLPITTPGTTEIIWTYDDGNGNTVTQAQNIIIEEDNTAPVPVLNELPDTVAQCEVTELQTPMAIDNCDGIIEGTHNVELPITTEGTTVVTWTYDDGNGNTSTQTQNLIIEEDVTPPEISVVDSITVNLQEGESAYIVEGNELDATATDNCTIQVLMNDANNGASLADEVFNPGVHDVIWIATDLSGNGTSKTTTITVNAFNGISPSVQNRIVIYPNPSKGQVTIANASGYNVKIMDMAGRLVKEKAISTNNYQVDLMKGIYLVQLTSNKETQTSVLMVE